MNELEEWGFFIHFKMTGDKVIDFLIRSSQGLVIRRSYFKFSTIMVPLSIENLFF